MPLQGQYAPGKSAWAREHAEQFEASRGAEKGMLKGKPIVVVTSVGAQTGKLRKTALMRVEHGGTYAVVASMGGATKHPRWYYNLKANPQLASILDWTYNKDATPRVPRGIGITVKAASPASAKLFLNWVYSKAGQQAMCDASFTAFRNKFVPKNCTNTLADVYAKVGQKNVILVPFSQKFVNDQPAYKKRWHDIFG